MTRVLIIKTSSMGDIVHNLPVIADIRRARPDHVIDWVVEEAYTDLVRMTRGIDRVIPIAWRRWRRQPSAATRDERRAFGAALREHRYDLVLDTQGLLKSALIAQQARLSRGGLRAGFSAKLARESLARLFYDRGFSVDPRLHAIERLRALAAVACGYANEPLGMPRFELDVPVTHFDWLPTATGETREDGSPRPARYAVLLHATARAEKAWPAERWSALIGLLCRAGITAVLPSGSPAERVAAEALATEAISSMRPCDSTPVVAPSITLVEAAALLGGAAAVVGVDTGLLHLAAAVDAPTVGLFGATPRWRFAPYWSPNAINLGSFGELGAQPGVSAVVESLERLGVLEPGASADVAASERAAMRSVVSRGGVA